MYDIESNATGIADAMIWLRNHGSPASDIILKHVDTLYARVSHLEHAIETATEELSWFLKQQYFAIGTTHGRAFRWDLNTLRAALRGEHDDLCQRCKGTGAVDARTSDDDPCCPDCDGSGIVGWSP